MRVFVAGASGVIGVRLLPLLVAAGHVVVGMTRSHPDVVEALGVEPIVCDVYDRVDLAHAMARFAPDVVLHQLTDLPDDHGKVEVALAANRRIRTEGTRNLLDAANGTKTVAQSTAFPAGTDEHERLVLDAGGVIVRYGHLYGPSTWYVDTTPPPPRINIDEAARRTLAALDAPPGTILEIVDP